MKTLVTFFVFLVTAAQLHAGEYMVEVRIKKGTLPEELVAGSSSSQEEGNARIEKISCTASDIWEPLKVEEGCPRSILRCTSRMMPPPQKKLERSTADTSDVYESPLLYEVEAIGGKPIEIFVKQEDEKNLHLRIAWGHRVPKKNFRLTMNGKLVKYMDTEMGDGGFEINTTLSQKALGSWRYIWFDKMSTEDDMNPATYFYRVRAVEAAK